MIIHSAKDQPFCLRVQYSHETNVLKNTKETQRFVSEFKNTFRIKKSMSVTKMAKKDDNYNKYYINPQQRYLKKSSNPKNELPNLQNEDFFYNNLHNGKFHNWKHPLKAQKQKQSIKQLELSNQNIKKLIAFKNHLENIKKSRAPVAIKQFLNKNNH